jgi:3-methyladenine DNA glycosylase AlkD
MNRALVGFVRNELAAVADPSKAAPMAAYMKTDMAFFGVPSPLRVPIARAMKERFSPGDAKQYRDNVLSLWNLDHREEKYLAIGYALTFKKQVTFDQVDLYQQMIVQGAWWDLVDEIAINVVGKVVLDDRERMRPMLETWIDHEDLWLRRTAIICQIKHKAETDHAMLFSFSLRRAHEKEFFIRKAIGWALREYAKVEPDAVRSFLNQHGDRLSGLSKREASKHL